MTSFSNPALELTCPCCNRTFRKVLSELSSGRKHRCVSCGTDIVFQGNGVKTIRKTLGDFEKSLTNIQIKL